MNGTLRNEERKNVKEKTRRIKERESTRMRKKKDEDIYGLNNTE